MSIERKVPEPNGAPSSRPWTLKRIFGEDRRLNTVLTVFTLPQVVTVGLVLFPAATGGTQSDALNSPYAITAAVNALFLTALAMCATAHAARIRNDGRVHRRGVAIMVVSAFLLIAENFSILYWTIGTTANFNVRLSYVDAVYFTLGTLTTAGTGTIAPTSRLARALVSGQMIVDLVFVAGALTIAITRWSESRAQ
jgi:hypothetical protein